MRAAMVGGAGYLAGRSMANASQREADQDEQLAQLQAERAQAAPVPSPAPAVAAAPSATDRVEALTSLKGLLDSGVLTQAEFEAEKARILGGG